MDSAPATSDAPPSRFGRELAARVRPRIGRIHRHDRPRLIGAVARSSVGFGLAVGRSQATRPVVTADALNSAALRPPAGWWSTQPDDTPEGSAPTPPTAPPRLSPRRHQPTWTDRLVPVSRFRREPTVRRTEQHTGSRRREPSLTGNPKLDALKRMLDAGLTPRDVILAEGGEPVGPPIPDFARTDVPRAPDRESAAPRPTGERRPAAPEAAAPPEPAAPQPAADHRRGDTTAGRDTAPGGLSRRLMPEPVGDTERGAATAAAALPSQQWPPADSRRTSPPATPGPVDSTRASGRSRRDTRRQARVDELRRMVEGQPPDPGSAASGLPPTPRPPWADAPEATSPGAPPSGADETIARSPATTGSPATTSRQPGAPAPQPSTRPTDSGRASTVDSSPPATAPGRPGESDGPEPEPGSAAGIDSGPSITAQALAERFADEVPKPVAPPAPVVSGDAAGPDAGGGESAASPPPLDRRTDPAAVNRRASDLRLQRMITDRPQPTPQPVGAASSPVATSATIQPVTALSLATAARPTLAARVMPALPSDPASGDVRPLRRVTLPRAMSSAHRPLTALTDSTVAAAPVSVIPAVLLDDGAEPLAATAIRRAGHHPRHRGAPGGRSAPASRFDPDRTAPEPAAPGDPTGEPPRLERLDRIAPEPAEPVGLPTPHRHAAHSVVAPGTGILRDVIHRVSWQTTHSAETTDSARPAVPGTPATTADEPTAQPTPSAPARPATRAARQAAAAVVAEQFMSELSQSVRARPAPLPTPFRPMAEAITGSDRVLLSTDTGSRRALRSVGKRAATTGNVIHLDADPLPSPAINEIIAHELTHVAHPSPAPRFFDDIDDSPEERRAETVARMMTTSPLAPTAGLMAPVVSRDRRRTTPQEGARMATTASSASPASSSTTSTTGPAGTIHRSIAPTSPASTSGGPDVIRRLEGPVEAPPAGSPSPAGAPSLGSDDASAWFQHELEQHLDTIVDRLEDRLRVDLERRGGRFWREI